MRNGDLSVTTNFNQSSENDSYGFFLYFFDEIQGHVPLFSYPQHLLNNKSEKEFISIHSIWWHQDKFLETDKFISMDLELGGVVYCGTLISCETKRIRRRSGMDSKKWQAERFVLIVKAPSEISFIAQEILHELKNRIQGSIGDNLCFLVENHLKIQEDSEVREFLEKKTKDIEQELTKLWISLIPKMPLAKLKDQLEENTLREIDETSTTFIHEPQITKSQEKPQLRFSIPMKHKLEQKGRPDVTLAPEPKRVRIVNIKISEDDRQVQVTARNNSSKIIMKALLKVYESQGFFGNEILVSKIKEWAPNQDVSIEFELANASGVIYFLKIEDEKGTIRVKRIVG